MKDDALEGCMKGVAGMAFGLLNGAYHIWCALVLYGWFVFPLTHVPLRYWQLYTSGLFLDVMLIGFAPVPKDDESMSSLAWKSLLRSLVVTLALGIGWAIHAIGMA